MGLFDLLPKRSEKFKGGDFSQNQYDDIYFNKYVDEKTIRDFGIKKIDNNNIVIPLYHRNNNIFGYMKKSVNADKNNYEFFSTEASQKSYIYPMNRVDAAKEYICVFQGFTATIYAISKGINALSVLGSRISCQQAQIIYRFKKIIVIPDKDDSENFMACYLKYRDDVIQLAALKSNNIEDLNFCLEDIKQCLKQMLINA